MTNMNTKSETHKEKMKRKKMNRAKRVSNATYATRKLWSIKPPKHKFEDIGGRVTLYHFTREYRLNDILKYGVIFGDVVTSPTTGFNTPNLTLESHYHDPANAQKQLEENNYYRLTIILDADDPKLINYGWFDKTYCNNLNRRVVERKVKKSGFKEDLDKQFIYKGAISPKMIKRVNVWNVETSFWDRLTKGEIENVCSKYRDLPFPLYGSVGLPCFSQMRVTGMTLGENDYTGMVESYYKDKDPKDPWNPLYRFTDELYGKLKGKTLDVYRNNVLFCVFKNDVPGAIDFIIKMYNRYSGKHLLHVTLINELERLHTDYRDWLSHHNKLDAVSHSFNHKEVA